MEGFLAGSLTSLLAFLWQHELTQLYRTGNQLLAFGVLLEKEITFQLKSQ